MSDDPRTSFAECLARHDRWQKRYRRHLFITSWGRERDGRTWAKLVACARDALDLSCPEQMRQVADALEDRMLRWFLALHVLAAWRVSPLDSSVEPLPAALFTPLIDAALRDADPSTARPFMDLVGASFGTDAGIEELRKRFRVGSVHEKVAVTWALYHVAGHPPEWHEFRLELLRAFPRLTDPDEQAVVFPSIALPPRDRRKPDELPLVDEAIEIGRTHPDAYIRAMAESHLGNEEPMKAWRHANRFRPRAGVRGKWRWFVEYVLRCEIPRR